jgi:hypothetical protein
VTIIVPQRAMDSAVAPSYWSALSSAIRQYRDLHLEVEAHSDASDSQAATQLSADRLRQRLIEAGIAPQIIVARGFGNTRPRTSNDTQEGRAENRRVEIVIAGDAIGTLATWDTTYSLTPHR